jgi:thiopeptide-type bacteriocin biosynthesis protein
MKPASNDYISVHIYYNAHDLRPVLLDCVEPLIDQLLEAQMIERYFALRYWEGGSHVRLRLLPKQNVDGAVLRAFAGKEIERFLQMRPSLFDPDPGVHGELMRTMFISEYGQAAFDEKYGATGAIPLEKNNSYSFVPYLPEYGRYGGPDGVEMSEEYFQLSTATALHLLRETNSQVRTSLLGLSFQLMLHFSFAYFSDIARTQQFFRRYREFFQRFSTTGHDVTRLSATFSRQADKIQSRVAELQNTHDLIELGGLGHLGEFVRSAPRLRARIAALFDAGRLTFSPPVASADEAAQRLLTSYLHMLNNRLGVHLAEEVYVAHMLEKSLETIDEH